MPSSGGSPLWLIGFKHSCSRAQTRHHLLLLLLLAVAPRRHQYQLLTATRPTAMPRLHCQVMQRWTPAALLHLARQLAPLLTNTTRLPGGLQAQGRNLLLLVEAAKTAARTSWKTRTVRRMQQQQLLLPTHPSSAVREPHLAHQLLLMAVKVVVVLVPARPVLLLNAVPRRLLSQQLLLRLPASVCVVRRGLLQPALAGV